VLEPIHAKDDHHLKVLSKIKKYRSENFMRIEDYLQVPKYLLANEDYKMELLKKIIGTQLANDDSD